MTDYATLHAIRTALDQYALQGVNCQDDAEFWVRSWPMEQRVQLLIALFKHFDATTEAAALKAIMDWLPADTLARVHGYAGKMLEKREAQKAEPPAG